ncbi:MAG TPA: isoprenylcysteine carboxylmethyltransferase family protein [Candidatus Binatia bacterium]|nr:isoprenylcysteine carboxylmethyltransferase family protein [Candidatus Binatia bacterium]
MPRLALIGYALFAVLAFGWRSVRQWRRTGSTGFRGFSGRPFSAEWWGGGLFALALVAAPLAAALDLQGALARVAALDRPSVRAIGCFAFVAGVAGTLWAQVAMGDSWRVGVDPAERTALVTEGPYRSVRNPIYTFMVIAAAGLACLTPNALALAAVAVLAFAVRLHVTRVEEPYLERVHGEAYRSYRAGTGRFVPGIGR